MAKVMLVEDDNNLREIYGARLLAEGYEIVSAKDGEEALTLAVQEKPDLIISDVMMPRISGFDMLDILRNAPETKETKVIMMTALSQAEDKSRADKLGADRYLVKSQVTLEDVANVVREVLEGTPSTEAGAEPEAPAPTVTDPTATPAPVTEEATPPQPEAPVVAEPAPSPAEESILPAPEPDSVEALAHPDVEVQDDNDTDGVETPPQEETNVATEEAPAPAPVAAVPDPTPLPVPPSPVPAPPNTDSVAPTPAPVPPAPEPVLPTPPVATTSDNNDDLPPVVEPAEPIKVELPQSAITQPEQISQDVSQPVEPSTPTPEPVAPEPEPAEDPQTFVGPNLAEALASEEAGTAEQAQPAPTPIVAPSTPEPATETPAPEPTPKASTEQTIPSVTNGTPSSTVIEPTQPAPTPVEEPEATVETNNNVAGMRVIQPINDPAATPDINELLANEERKAAVENPTANTVITPETPAAAEPTQENLEVKQPPKNNGIDNIAL